MEKKAVFCIRSDKTYLERFASQLAAIKKDHQVEILEDFNGFSQIAANHPAVILLTVRSSADLQQAVQALIPLQQEILQRSLIAIAVQYGLNDKQEKLLVRAGCKEIMPEKADPRGLLSKITRYLKITEQNLAQSKEKTQDKLVQGGAKKSSVEAAAADIVVFAEPITLSKDFWIIPQKRPAQRNMGRWIISAIGPSPGIGTWMPENGLPHYFAFRVNPSHRHEFFSEEGHWVFHGAKPEFSFELGRWNFVSHDPKLEWVGENGAVVAVRLWLNPETKKLMIAQNSDLTVSWLPKIEATFDRDYRFRDEALGVGEGVEQAAPDTKELEIRTSNLVKNIPDDVVKFLTKVKPQFEAKSGMFAKLDEKTKIRKFFEVAGEYQDRGIIWLPNRIFLSNLRVHDVHLDKGTLDVIMTPPVHDPMALIDGNLRASPIKRIYVNIKLLETSLFFDVNRDQIKCEDGILTIPIPAAAYEVQRRGGVRLSNSPKIPGLQLTKIPPTAKGEWKIMDLSAGGIGLEMDAGSFSFANDRPFKIDLTVVDTTLSLMCMPRWFKTDEVKGRFRVGAQFVHLSEASLENLELYVMEKHLERIRQSMG